MTALTREAARTLDRRAIDEYGVPSIVLMENASRAVADHVESLVEGRERPVYVLAGPGNNGGDGLAIARTLANRGIDVSTWGYRVERAAPGSDLARQVALARTHGLALRDLERPAERERLFAGIDGAALVVDALFGTGLERPLEAPFIEIAEQLEDAARPVVAVDVPTGLDATDGRILGAAVRASTTVTFVAPKRGLLEGHGPEYAGRVLVAEIGVPRALLIEAGLVPG
ncbi:MAG: NAD(P)H-hydrate epimerase [Planctomycetota bacterium]